MSVWTRDMDKLLLWMRKQNMPFRFCAEVISREVKQTVTRNACVGRHHKLMNAGAK